MSNPFPKNTEGKPPEQYEPGDKSKASQSKITTPDEDQKKLQKLYSIIDGRINEVTQDIKTALLEQKQAIQEIINALNQASQQPQQTGTQPGQVPSLADRPELMTGIAQIIQAWKGGSPDPKEDYFSQMSKNITLNMLQAGVDGIMRNVYDNYNPVPPNRSIVQKTQPQNRFQ